MGTNSPIKPLDVLRSNLIPSYVNLFHAILRITDGVKFLVDLRSDLLVSRVCCSLCSHLPLFGLHGRKLGP